jgi:nitrogen fixation/metabolism regulation signal transduction histidine kinase
MLWTIAVVLIILWMLGLVTGFTMGSFIHIIFAAAVALLVISLSQEAMINQKMRRVLRNRGAKPDGKRMRERFVDQPAPSRSMP